MFFPFALENSLLKNPTKLKRIALTGANGSVGRLIAPYLKDAADRWRLVDRVLPPEVVTAYGAHVESHVGDLSDRTFADTAFRNVDAIVHLAGHAHEAPWSMLAPDNIEAVVHLFAAAARHGVSRVVLASTMHVMGMYERDAAINESMQPRPDSLYAVTKLFAESLGRLYAEKDGMAVTALRLGHVHEGGDTAEPFNTIAPADVAKVITLSLERAVAGFSVLHTVPVFPGEPAVSHGFPIKPRETATKFETREEVLNRLHLWWRDQPAALKYRGGIFAARPLPRDDEADAPA